MMQWTRLHKRVVLIAAASAATVAGEVSACATSLSLSGAVSITACDRREPGCVPAAELVYKYSEAIPHDPALFQISLQSSPWRFYDADMRVLPVEDLAAIIKRQIKPEVKKIVLHGSWTAVAPEKGAKSLAQKLSDALGGFPVTGMDGFLWLSKDGAIRTTHQAFTTTQGGAYGAKDGDDVMVAYVAGWPVQLESKFAEGRNAEGLMRAGAGWDIFHLCPEHALATFEAAAKMANPIAAYNAAMIRLERKEPGDAEAARALLSQAAESGDHKAKEVLQRLGN